jgi:aspartate aminotransferase
MIKFSSRVERIVASQTLKLVQIKNQLQSEGKMVIDFGAGEPDFPTPDEIKEAGIAAIRQNYTKYTTTSGIKELKQAISKCYEKEQCYAPAENEILVSGGSKYGGFLLMLALVEKGDEVILPLPYWVSYPEMVKFAGGTPVYADHLATRPLFAITAESYIGVVTSKTKAILVNSPSNPTGKVMPAAELEKLISFCLEKNIFLVVDDCYRKIIYTDEQFPSPLALVPEARPLMAVVASFSKSYAMTGWRLGYTIAPRDVIAAMNKIQEHSTSNACSITQKAGVAALLSQGDDVARMVAEYKKRRDFVAAELDRIGNVSYSLPEGAFYLFADFSFHIRRLGLSSDSEFVMKVLQDLGIIMTPGSAFGADGYVRISYANSLEELSKGFRLLAEFLSKQQ